MEETTTHENEFYARNDCWNEKFGEWKMAISLEPTSYNITTHTINKISHLNDDKYH